MLNTEKTMDKIVALCKNRGFVYSGSEIYGGLANTWDYGPLRRRTEKQYKKSMVEKIRTGNTRYNVGLDCAILNESADMGSFRTSRRIFRPSYGL